MSLTHTTLVFFAALLAGIEASAPRLSQSQKCGIFGFSDRKTCRPGAALGVFDGNWTDLAETELINNRRRLVIPYVIRPNFSDKPDLSWKGRSRGVTKPANAEEWINRIRPAVAKAAEFYEPTNVFFKEYYQTDIDSGRFTDKHYVIISDFYDGVSTGCTSDLGPNLSGEKNYIEVDAENCRRDMGNGNEYHPGVIAHEFMHVLGFLHEHQRKDRDKFLKVTIPRNDVFNYDIKRGGRLLTAYDPESITHYGLNKYIKINSAHPPSTNMNLIGQREKLSALDVQQINLMYPIDETVCQCSNGSPAIGSACSSHNSHICSPTGCNDYHHYDSSTKQCKRNLCQCSNGSPATGSACSSHESNICSPTGCNDYHHYDSSTKGCKKNVCQCSNGSSATGSACSSHNSNICSPTGCNDYYHYDSSTKECKRNVCQCSNGSPAAGSACSSHKSNICSPTGCNDYHHYDSSTKECKRNVCQCLNGSAATGSACSSHNSNICSPNGCNDYYHYDSSTKECKRKTLQERVTEAQENCSENAKTTCGCVTNYGVDFIVTELQNDINLWTDRSYKVWNLPSYLQGTQLLKHPHRLNTDLNITHEVGMTGFIYVFYEIGHEERNGGWAEGLQDFVKMPENAQWDHALLAIWRRQLNEVSEIEIRVTSKMVGGVALDLSCS